MIPNVGILGSSGFIGADLVNQLSLKKYNVYLFCRKKKKKYLKSKNIFYIKENFCDKKFKEFFNKIDVLINLIGEVNLEKKMQKTNVKLLKKIICCSEKKIKKIIHISSVAVYGKCISKIISENSSCVPLSEYGKTKLAGEKLLIKASKNCLFKTIIIRPANVIGKNMKNDAIYQLINSISKNFFFYFNNYNSILNYVNVSDLNQVIVKLIRYNNFKNYEIFNFSHNIKLYNFINIVCKKLKKKNNFFNIPRALVNFCSLFYYFYKRFPLKPSRVEALTINFTYSNKKLSRVMNLKKYKNLKKGILEMVEKYN